MKCSIKNTDKCNMYVITSTWKIWLFIYNKWIFHWLISSHKLLFTFLNVCLSVLNSQFYISQHTQSSSTNSKYPNNTIHAAHKSRPYLDRQLLLGHILFPFWNSKSIKNFETTNRRLQNLPCARASKDTPSGCYLLRNENSRPRFCFLVRFARQLS